MTVFKTLVWNKDGRKFYSGKHFQIFNITWNDQDNEWMVDEDSEIEGILHPVTLKLTRLNKPFNKYGEVIEEDWEEEAKVKVNIETKLEMGTPSLGIAEEEDHELAVLLTEEELAELEEDDKEAPSLYKWEK